MGKASNIVHMYFKGHFDGLEIFVQVNPIQWKGTEITREPDGTMHLRELEFDPSIVEDLKQDGFIQCSPLEFNLYLSGLAGNKPA